jgi:plastocyanin
VVATPLSASEEPAPAEDPAAVPAPEPPAPEPEPAAPEPAPAPAAPPEPAAPAPAAPEQPAAALAPAEPEAPEPQRVRDDAPVDEPRASAAASTTVTIKDFDFTPAAITVNVGDTVTWTNDGPTAHSATASNGSFDTGIYGAGESRSHTFDQAGTFAYICTPHPFMKGTVTVQAAATQGGGDGATDGDTGSTGSTAGTGTTGTGSTDSGGSGLPATGLDAGSLLLLGLGALALGAWLRRGAAAPRPAGRIGW